MRIIADRYIPFLQGILEPYATVSYLAPEEITPEAVRDADAMLIRTRTRCNEALLAGSRIRFIATATIGYDHIDAAFCEKHHIAWSNAPGCNAQGVADYVEAAIDQVFPAEAEQQQKTIGIIGVGHVGSLVAQMAERKGLRVLLNDPPKQIGVPLSEIACESDIITIHTPLSKEGNFPTCHLLDASFLSQCRPDVLLINAARGGVVDEKALLERLASPDNRMKAVIDTWENEPHINKALLEKVSIGTCHIAGYTLQGKINATNQCLEALCRHFHLPVLQIPEKSLPLQPVLEQGWLSKADKQLRARPDDFETLRETYKLR